MLRNVSSMALLNTGLAKVICVAFPELSLISHTTAILYNP